MPTNTKIMRISYGIALVLLAFGASGATTYYVSPAGGNVGAGGWATSITLGAVPWGSLGSGDIVYIGAGTYGSGFAVGGAGGSLVKAATNGPVGVANFNGGITINPANVTVDGGGGTYGTNRNFVLAYDAGVSAQVANPKILYVEITGTGPGNQTGIDMRNGSGGEVGWCYLHNLASDSGITMVNRNDGNDNYDLTTIHNCTIQVNNAAGGQGTDGISCARRGMTIYSNHVYGATAAIVNGGHQDLIQCSDGRYIKIYANRLENAGDSYIDQDLAGSTGPLDHFLIYNNLFIHTNSSVGSAGIRVYSNLGDIGGSGYADITVYEEVRIDNNTFVDFSRCSQNGKAISMNDLPAAGCTVTDGKIRNNIIMNCGEAPVSPRPAIVCGACLQDSGWDIDYNLLNAGAHGNTDISVGGVAWTQTHPQSGVPEFVSYSEFNAANLHLAAAGTVATDHALGLTYFTRDRDFVSRPQGAAWDIGAYEYSEGGGAGPTNPYCQLSASSYAFGYVLVGSSSNTTLTLSNLGMATLSGTGAVSAPFSITAPAGGVYNLATNTGTNLTIAYAPTATGVTNLWLTLTDNSPQSGQTVALSGKAYPLVDGYTFTPASNGLVESTVSQTWSITNGVIWAGQQCTTPANSARVTLGVNVSNSQYFTLTARVNAPNDGANSMFVSWNAEANYTNDVWDVNPFFDGWVDKKVSKRGAGTFDTNEFDPMWYQLTAGTNVLTFYGREAEMFLGTVTLNDTNTAAPGTVTNLNVYLSGVRGGGFSTH